MPKKAFQITRLRLVIWKTFSAFVMWKTQYSHILLTVFSQSAMVIADWSIWQFWHNILTSCLETLLLGHIGMFIPWLLKSWITKPETPRPNSSFNYPKLRLQCGVRLFNLLLVHFGFCDPRLFKSWDYLNLNLSFVLIPWGKCLAPLTQHLLAFSKC